MTPTASSAGVDYLSLGFQATRGTLEAPHPHSLLHTEVELLLVLEGTLRYFISGSIRQFEPGRLIVFWGGTPHAAVDVKPPGEYVQVHVPLDWVLAWELPGGFTERLLEGASFEEPDASPERCAEDRGVLLRWWAVLASEDPVLRRIVPLEVNARLARFARSANTAGRPRASEDPDTITRIAGFIAQHYREPITVKTIGREIGLHPDYLAQLFRRSCGIRLWEYVVRLRIAHAQRLLISTNLKITDICFDSGFGSLAQFYDAFGRYSGAAPRAYRIAHRA